MTTLRELGPELATPRVGAYIRSRFDHIQERYDARTVWRRPVRTPCEWSS